MQSLFDQSNYECKVEWGKRGARDAAKRGDITIIVDVLSFSSTVVTAVNQNAIIYPYPPNLDGKAYAKSIGADYILGRNEAAVLGKATLSPVSFNESHTNNKFVLCSLNGAFCTWLASKVPSLIIGSFLNMSSVVSYANQLKRKFNANITVIPCGEVWNDSRENEDLMRPAIEDYLGAGAILAELEGTKSPEAEVCIGAFVHSKHKIKDLIWECGSGRELRVKGFEEDVRHCSQMNRYNVVPVLKNDCFVDALKREKG
ncbi:2-phosphosulfolactate phosphatase [Bacillus sp. AFS041924]|uniref:2-phosphosulfolactate phosphatase n=1 Tax=Bacillus sp. AFS041924 TaxID=2033503 RepID=UPI000BFBF37D|nr:2-phosphosulfolactate phosphatase [Bacillus sp. AFS041924]PGS47305.1 2-phosphosulfolactate phosphatase [Bacillus sp. AFS041924]